MRWFWGHYVDGATDAPTGAPSRCAPPATPSCRPRWSSRRSSTRCATTVAATPTVCARTGSRSPPPLDGRSTASTGCSARSRRRQVLHDDIAEAATPVLTPGARPARRTACWERCPSPPRSRRSAASCGAAVERRELDALRSAAALVPAARAPRARATPSRGAASARSRRAASSLVSDLEGDAFLLMHLRMTGRAAARPAGGRALRPRALRPRRRRARDPLLRPAALRDGRDRARHRRARRVPRRPPRPRAALRRAHRGGAADDGARPAGADQGLPARPAARRGRREHLRRRGAVPRADPPAAPGGGAEARAVDELAVAVRETLLAGLARGRRDDRRLPPRRRRQRGVPERVPRPPPPGRGLPGVRRRDRQVRRRGRGTYACEHCQPRPRVRRSRPRGRAAHA